jgi:hypothetical protein
MTDLQLPAVSNEAAPEFSDAVSAKAWLEHLPLANVIAAQHQLLAQIEEFNRFAAKGNVRLATLETLREAVHFVEIEQARRFSNRALPMADNEAAVFDETLSLWERMRLGYQRCLQAVLADEPGMKAQAGLVCQRVLAYTGLKMFHYHRAYRQVPAREWRELHQGYARAEQLGVAEEAVKDYLNRDVNDTSTRIAYMRAVLLGMANPNELSQRQLTFVAFLLERWAEKAELGAEPPADEVDLPPLAVDLAGDACPERGVKAADPRYVDVKRLAKSLRNRIGLLRKGDSPAKLALGEDCVQPSCEQLLVFLYRQWCQARPPRDPERKRAVAAAQCCTEFPAIHYYVSGRVFRQPDQPGETKELTAKQRAEMEAFGRLRTSDEDDYSVVHGFLVENWKIEDESAQGLRLTRSAGTPGHRHTHGRLIAVKPGDAKAFMLAQMRWLTQNDAGDIQAGVRLLPGLPAATAVRPTGLNVQDAKWVQALSLTAVAALNAPPSLVLATGWFKPKRIIEAHIEGQGTLRVRLLEMIERGSDYERIAYEIVA